MTIVGVVVACIAAQFRSQRRRIVLSRVPMVVSSGWWPANDKLNRCWMSMTWPASQWVVDPMPCCCCCCLAWPVALGWRLPKFQLLSIVDLLLTWLVVPAAVAAWKKFVVVCCCLCRSLRRRMVTQIEERLTWLLSCCWQVVDPDLFKIKLNNN